MKNSSPDDSKRNAAGEHPELSKKGSPSSLSRPEEVLSNLSEPRLFLRRDRFTYTFVCDREAASLHFDASRGEIFLNGHNLRNMKLNESHRAELKTMAKRLKDKEADPELLAQYEACLSKFLRTCG